MTSVLVRQQFSMCRALLDGFDGGYTGATKDDAPTQYNNCTGYEDGCLIQTVLYRC